MGTNRDLETVISALVAAATRVSLEQEKDIDDGDSVRDFTDNATSFTIKFTINNDDSEKSKAAIKKASVLMRYLSQLIRKGVQRRNKASKIEATEGELPKKGHEYSIGDYSADYNVRIWFWT